MKKSFNVYSAKVKIIDKEGRVLHTRWIRFSKENSDKRVVDPQVFEFTKTIDLCKHFKKELSVTRKDKYILQVKTTKGQIYFSNVASK